MYQIVSQGEGKSVCCFAIFYFYMQKMPYQLECVKQNIVSLSSECACRSLAPPCDRNDV